MARYDLLPAVCHTASCIAKWTDQRDMDLFRLICYSKCTSHYRMSSWVGDRMEDVLLKQISDADLASDVRTHRSTSACYQAIWGHAPEQGSLWDPSDRRVFPLAPLRLRLSLPTLPCERSCLQLFRFGKYCLGDKHVAFS
eukprot:2291619-Pyramimonas_sp.AAC.1